MVSILSGKFSVAAIILFSTSSVAYYFPGNEFLYVQEGKNYAAAQADCVARRGNLASVHSEAENTKMWHESVGGAIWVGLDDREEEGTFKYVDGSNYTYDNFKSTEPDNYFDEDCTQMLRDRGWWGDVKCTGILTYFCRNKPCTQMKTKTTAEFTISTGYRFAWGYTVYDTITVSNKFDCFIQCASDRTNCTQIHLKKTSATEYTCELLGCGVVSNVEKAEGWTYGYIAL